MCNSYHGSFFSLIFLKGTSTVTDGFDTARLTESYRHRYALYVASVFHISVEAAETEATYQLKPRRPSEMSESEIYRA